MKLHKSKELKSIIESAKQNPNVIALILFGSYAKGTQKPNSDIDYVL